MLALRVECGHAKYWIDERVSRQGGPFVVGASVADYRQIGEGFFADFACRAEASPLSCLFSTSGSGVNPTALESIGGGSGDRSVRSFSA
jgi:hypothetical protein